jgi:hypothetical protein
VSRRRFVVTSLAGVVATPLAVETQRTIARIGYLSTRSPDEAQSITAAFIRGLKEMGYVEGTKTRLLRRRKPKARCASLEARICLVVSIEVYSGAPQSRQNVLNRSGARFVLRVMARTSGLVAKPQAG